MRMEIREIKFGSELYQRSSNLRENVLRQPLGLVLSSEDTQDEDKQIHIAAIENGVDVIGTIILKPASSEVSEIRGVAVAPHMQNMGIGKQLVIFAEQLAIENGFLTIEMKARISARKFYEKLGYNTTGPEFIKSTIPHIKMEKLIAFSRLLP